MSAGAPPEEDLEKLQRDTFAYFLRETNPRTGLVADKTRAGAPSSIAATGLGLSCYAVGAERGFITRAEAAALTLTTLRFFRDSPHGEDEDATGYRGFYYHFLDMTTGRRAWSCELSIIDTALFIAGALTSMMYFDRDGEDEREIRAVVTFLYERIDWAWAMNGDRTMSMGWKPRSGFLHYGWEGYTEAMLLYILALGSSTHSIPAASYPSWTSTYQWENLYGYDHLFAGPLFIHQLSHIWIDFRGIQDDFMREKRCDYFENSRRATHIQQHHAILNPGLFEGYAENCWGTTACAGPGYLVRCLKGVERHFFDYVARGVPYGPDDGTIAPWAAAASLPFAPELVFPALDHFRDVRPDAVSTQGLLTGFNPTFAPDDDPDRGWVCPEHYGLDQGPVVLMIENYRSGLLWRLMRDCPIVVTGLRRAGFRNGWLASSAP